ncbi:hypothetical protein I6N90_21565 [Paenibacillus sp. GSMTC-2017]|uniref:hypothetical protein n=1 Tax=Paenibacillus sp. GSMTC-2017 TaxID=2794350 RepID=UPI0018D6FA56|nr:hypothetical protein [Paenibacillus sp. GSMTC-2017]MBH5320385.1 hypothetical protein [Paenibacillus sp. GSMTC-2017]
MYCKQTASEVGLLNKNGKQAPLGKLYPYDGYKDGLVIVESNSKLGYADTNGKVVNSAQYDEVKAYKTWNNYLAHRLQKARLESSIVECSKPAFYVVQTLINRLFYSARNVNTFTRRSFEHDSRLTNEAYNGHTLSNEVPIWNGGIASCQPSRYSHCPNNIRKKSGR